MTAPGTFQRDPLANPTFPFADRLQPIPFEIPLQPTPKTYRSQSYSVGQLDLDSPTNTRPTARFVSPPESGYEDDDLSHVVVHPPSPISGLT
jgi:hypothetical protein